MNRVTMNGYTRVSKAEALKRFAAGEEILICPCKCRPKNQQGFWYLTDLEIEREIYGYIKGDTEATPELLFTRVVDSYTYYQCQYNELGKYPAFYRKEE